METKNNGALEDVPFLFISGRFFDFHAEVSSGEFMRFSLPYWWNT